jgi:glycosyltransferase involved in cell wall biosynthesis
MAEATLAELVTCVVPVYNGSTYLGAAIDSVISQDHRPLEILVVDDGSVDDSATIAAAYGPPVRVIRQSNQGPGMARNTGVSEARGSFVCFLDADDLYRPGKVSLQLERFRARPDLEVSLCVAENFWEEGMEAEEQLYRANGKLRMSHTFNVLLARRSVFDRVGPLDGSLVGGEEQIDWFARLVDIGPVIEVLDEVLVLRRMHQASLTHNVANLDPFVDLVKRRLDQRRSGRE